MEKHKRIGKIVNLVKDLEVAQTVEKMRELQIKIEYQIATFIFEK